MLYCVMIITTAWVDSCSRTAVGDWEEHISLEDKWMRLDRLMSPCLPMDDTVPLFIGDVTITFPKYRYLICLWMVLLAAPML